MVKSCDGSYCEQFFSPTVYKVHSIPSTFLYQNFINKTLYSIIFLFWTWQLFRARPCNAHRVGRFFKNCNNKTLLSIKYHLHVLFCIRILIIKHCIPFHLGPGNPYGARPCSSHPVGTFFQNYNNKTLHSITLSSRTWRPRGARSSGARRSGPSTWPTLPTTGASTPCSPPCQDT